MSENLASNNLNHLEERNRFAVGLFAGAHHCRRRPGGVVEVFDLAIDTVPKGTLLRSGMCYQSSRVSHIFEHDGNLYNGLVSHVFPGEPGGPVYAIVSDPVKIGTPDANYMLAKYDELVAEGGIQDMPKDIVPTIKNCQKVLETRPEPEREPLLYGKTTWSTEPRSSSSLSSSSPLSSSESDLEPLLYGTTEWFTEPPSP